MAVAPIDMDEMDVIAAIVTEVATAIEAITRTVQPLVRMQCVTVHGAMDHGRIASLANIQRTHGHRSLSRVLSLHREIQQRHLRPSPLPHSLVPISLVPISRRARKVRQQKGNAVSDRSEADAAGAVAAGVAGAVEMKPVRLHRMRTVKAKAVSRLRSLPEISHSHRPHAAAEIPAVNSIRRRYRFAKRRRLTRRRRLSLSRRFVRSRSAASICLPPPQRRNHVAKLPASQRRRPNARPRFPVALRKRHGQMPGPARSGHPDQVQPRVRTVQIAATSNTLSRSLRALPSP
jgi:hypothetical protein